MSKRVFALSLFAGIPILAVTAFGQTNPAQAPIACGVENNVEDAECQTKLKGLFTRKGDTLTLKLDGGKSKAYVGNAAACAGDNVDVSKCLVFVVLKYFPQARSFLVERGYFECGAYLFVRQHTGSETVMHSIPDLSPNAKYLLSIDQSDACDREYDIAIWSMQTDPPKLEFKYDPKQYENWDVTAWEADTHIKLKGFINGKTSYDQEAELVRNERGWALQLGRKIDRPR
jgi:hypothetical protein